MGDVGGDSSFTPNGAATGRIGEPAAWKSRVIRAKTWDRMRCRAMRVTHANENRINVCAVVGGKGCTSHPLYFAIVDIHLSQRAAVLDMHVACTDRVSHLERGYGQASTGKSGGEMGGKLELPMREERHGYDDDQLESDYLAQDTHTGVVAAGIRNGRKEHSTQRSGYVLSVLVASCSAAE
ncbi:hypothetical protein BDY19DRAFT_904996 [Irpex rosettiformis]|uniref:Uncharacterized protein n=1 Tax=Irpex rosettiformis TaxID=378272 RepID=A0ACB8U8M6_9APHY|nr:hypothetical protein BDY19DRAFT_904996 [Irpex rosettiformis]